MLESDRHLPLFYTDYIPVPTLTVENYCKWYCLYLVNCDGTILSVSFYDLPDVGNDITVGDHVINPMSVCAYAAEHRYHVDSEALAAITRRWFNSYHDTEIPVVHFTNRNAS